MPEKITTTKVIVEQREPKTKAELLAIMRAANVATVTIEYNGSGDDGSMQDVLYDAGEGQPISDELAKLLKDDSDIRGDWECFHDRVLEAADYDGYWNGDGGGGKIILDVATGKVTIEHYWYETVTNEDAPKEVEL